jgi:glycosyltransferase involved in cell wall biosynthesis
MRIGIDARELCGRSTGVGRYLGGLLAGWAIDPRARAHEFLLYAPGPVSAPLDGRRFPTRTVSGAGGSWWEQAQVPPAVAADHLDVWFAPAYSAPLRLTVPIVVAIHDLSFVAHPEWFRVREGARRRWLTNQSASRAASVITISEFSKRELVDRLKVPVEKIRVIPPGVGAGGLGLGAGDSGLGAGDSGLGAGDWGLGAGDCVLAAGSGPTSPQSQAPSPYRVLFVGSIFNRRHVTDLIRGFAPIARAHPDVSLDIVGDNRSFPREDLRQTIAAEQIEAQVRWHEYVSDQQLAAMYAAARAFAFLSEYEGLGLTPLEALAAGVPPLLLDTAVARESCGAAALYVPVHDLAATTRGLESLLFDDTTRRQILSAAPAELAKYSWPRAARETLAVIEATGSAMMEPS